MRRVHRDDRALSEIVGTLMLVVIVVGAATAFAAFVANYQKQLQREQAIAQERSLESLSVLNLVPTLGGGGTSWSSLNFTVASGSVNPTSISDVRINDDPVGQYTAWRVNLSTGLIESVTVSAGGTLTLGPTSEAAINVSLPSGLVLPSTLAPDSFVKIDLYTVLLDHFSRAFLPPSAIALVDIFQSCGPTGCTLVQVLDGSHSFQASNGTLVRWTWSVSPALSPAPPPAELAEVQMAANTTYTIGLVVANSFGLTAAAQISFFS